MNRIMIFGREPAAIVGVIEAGLVLALTFGVPGLTGDSVVNVIAVVATALGVYTAYVTRDTLLGVVVGLAKALIALAVGYGLTLSPEQTGAIIAMVTMGLGLFQRTQTAPAISPSFSDPTPAAEIPVAVDASPGEAGRISAAVAVAAVLVFAVLLFLIA